MNTNIRAEDVTFSKDHIYSMFAGPLTFLATARIYLKIFVNCSVMEMISINAI
jgi:hypothetical protein